MDQKEIKCPITGGDTELVFEERILGKYNVSYFYCPQSGLLRTEKPYWMNEAYEDAIVDTDTGLVSRNMVNTSLVATILEGFSLCDGRFLDLAGGYGLLTRMLRDRGFDCYTTDKYCDNLFAKSFEPEPDFNADCLFAFEVMEHIEHPFEFIAEAFETHRCRTLIFSTLTFDGEVPDKNWWYYVFGGGQHITFYQPRTLKLLAEKLGCKYYKITDGYHLFTDRETTFICRLILSNKYLRKIYSMYVKWKRRNLSRTHEDFINASAKPSSQ